MKRKTFILASICILLALVMQVGISPAFAQWSDDPAVNTPVCTVPGEKAYPAVVSDGNGGAIIAWQDKRKTSTIWDVCVQRIDAMGTVQWTRNGVPVCTDGRGCQIVSDGARGAIVAWDDWRDVGPEGQRPVYAQRIDASGAVQWQTNGIALSGSTMPGGFDIISDETGGAIVTWSGGGIKTWPGGYTLEFDVFAQRVDPTGTALWAKAAAICTTADLQHLPRMVSDGVGGAIIAWEDKRPGSSGSDIYTQRVGDTGRTMWTTNGVAISTAPGNQENFEITSDGQGGAIIVWEDRRVNADSIEVYCQKINSSGTVQWTANGVAAGTLSGPRKNITPLLVCDGQGGAIIVWTHYQLGPTSMSNSMCGVHISMAGSLGTVKRVSLGKQADAVVSDGNGGMTIFGTSSTAVPIPTVQFACHLDRKCIADWLVTASGPYGYIGYPSAGGLQSSQGIEDGSGGAIFVGSRAPGGLGAGGIYAQRVGRHGALVPKPTNVSVGDVPEDQGGKVTIRWRAGDLDTVTSDVVQYYSIWRAIPQASLQRIPATPLSEITEKFSGRAYRQLGVNGTPWYWEWLANQPKHHFAAYTYSSPTLYDSMSSTNGMHYFLVSTHTGDPNIFWDSQPDSGWSVDNLSPHAPMNLAGSVVGSSVVLRWNHNSEPDFKEYRVYRGAVANCDPDTMTAFASCTDTSYVDTDVSWTRNYYYSVCAFDVHGNRSNKSNEIAIIFVGVEGESNSIPKTFALYQNYPNPFNPTTVISYQLSAVSYVTLKVCDMLGREVATLVDGRVSAGRYDVVFDARLTAGGQASSLSSGIYFYRLMAAGDNGTSFTRTNRMVLMK